MNFNQGRMDGTRALSLYLSPSVALSSSPPQVGLGGQVGERVGERVGK